MGMLGRVAMSFAACFLASLALLAIPAGVSFAGEQSSPSAASAAGRACPPSPTAPATSTTGAPATSAAAAEASRSTAPTPSPYRPAPEEVVACVGSQEISGATFAHWAIVAENGAFKARRDPAAEPTKPVMEITLGFLITADWVMGEAADLGIEVSPREVRHTFDRLRAQQFPKRSAFNKFLKQTGQTIGDLLLRVRLKLLTTRIKQRVAGHGSARRRLRALARFLVRFKRKWKAQTYFETLYKMSSCGHAAASLQ